MPADIAAGPKPDGPHEAADAPSGLGEAASHGGRELSAVPGGSPAGSGAAQPASGEPASGAAVPGAAQPGSAPPGSPPPGSPPPGPGAADPGPAPPGPGAAPRTGRNLPVALGVGLGLGGLALATLFTIKLTFLVYVAAVAGIGLWELARALEARGIRLPLPPLAVGGLAALALAYWEGERALVACLALTALGILAWRLPGGTAGYVRDVTAGVFALAYLPLLGSFVALMLAARDGSHRTLIFLILTVCSDVGGYFAGIMLGRHPMAPVISPRKTWEGLAGSVLACVLAGAISLPLLLNGALWQGILVGVAAVAAATLGDLAVSMIKRDLEIKDMGSVLPGHGGVLDRADSLLATAPVVWLLLLVFVPLPH